MRSIFCLLFVTLFGLAGHYSFPLSGWHGDAENERWHMLGDGTDRGQFTIRRIVRQPAYPAVADFLDLLEHDDDKVRAALKNIANAWQPGNQALLLEVYRFCRNPVARAGITRLLRKKELVRTPDTSPPKSLDAWYQLIWGQDIQPHPKYAAFKAKLYERLDPRFAEYFHDDRNANIRLDEVRWGGVRRDGIPPLKNPKTIGSKEASYLADADVVFGVHVNGEARAYPKRILAWHEMVKDNVGGKSVNGVYCTLCGAMILYDPVADDGTHYELGTSGFLYRSNKLMYDHKTKSMWSTTKGKPVIGPLVGKGIKLRAMPVVTTTWGTWKANHPDTRVLSLDTGHRRDYGKGVAYKDYFATDQLMFAIPKTDTRLKNKDEVFVIRTPEAADQPLAIAISFLTRNPVHHESIGEKKIVVITDRSGANRAFDTGNRQFVSLDADGKLVDSSGGTWTVAEEAIVNDATQGELSRLPAHRAFWFGWQSVYPKTRLVK